MSIATAAQEYAAEFDIPIEEIREWYRASDDKPGLVDYMLTQVQDIRQWRQRIADDMHARVAA
jgi:hypothetical protein